MHAHGRDEAAASERRLVIVLCMALASLIAEVVAGLLTGSLALLADSGHLLTDVLGLAMALAAIRFARRPATPGKTYGFYRAEILAALVNSILLLGVAGWILFEAYQRLNRPMEINAWPMLLVALGALAMTLIGARLLHPGAQTSLNMRGAFLEVVGDLLGAVGTIIAALVILTTGWVLADPLVSAVIGVLIVPRAWSLLRSVIDVLLEATPRHLDMQAIEAAMREVPGVDSVHDLHLWTITSGFDAMSAHVRANGRPSEDVLHDVRRMLSNRYGIEHMTLQVESVDHADDGACCITDPRCFVPKSVRPGLSGTLLRPN
ncbi:MAG TPA: cation diffusion facilitator family transporter [Chloroflexota bacterium]